MRRADLYFSDSEIAAERTLVAHATCLRFGSNARERLHEKEVIDAWSKIVGERGLPFYEMNPEAGK